MERIVPSVAGERREVVMVATIGQAPHTLIPLALTAM
jgi:hypothetical protein